MKKNPSVSEAQKISKRKKGIIKAKSEFFRAARYGLTLQEHRIIYYAILVGQQDGKPFEPVTMSIREFKELYNLKSEKYYTEICKLSKKLVGKVVEVTYKDDDGHHFLQAPWLLGIEYHLRNGAVTITPNPELKRFFEGKPFTTSELAFLTYFKSQFAERLYELLKSMPLNQKPIFDFEPAELCEKLAVPPSYRVNYADLRKYALAPAIRDINEFTDLDVQLLEKRGGRGNKVQLACFYIKKKDVPKLADRVERGEFGPLLSEEEQITVLQELLGEELPGQLALDGSEVTT